MLEEPNVDEDQTCCDDENSHQDWAEVEHMLAFADKPEVIHIHLRIAVEEAVHRAYLIVANHEVGDWQAEAG